MIATVLIDNITKNELASEWGLAIFIEYDGHKILLDAGTTGKFLENAQALGIDVGEAEVGVLSHAHYDHADGMAAFFATNEDAAFYLRDTCRENCYHKKWIFRKYVGIRKGYLTGYRERIRLVSGDYEIFPGVTLVPHKTPGLEEMGRRAGMYVKKDRRYCPDCFDHEQSLVLDTDKGLVIFNSCSHGGADNIIREISETFPGRNIHALIGGFHLYESSETEVRKLAAGIRETGIEKIYTGHCTGKRAFDILRQELGEGVIQLYTGLRIQI